MYHGGAVWKFHRIHSVALDRMNGYHGYNFDIRISDPKIGSKLLNRSLGFF